MNNLHTRKQIKFATGKLISKAELKYRLYGTYGYNIFMPIYVWIKDKLGILSVLLFITLLHGCTVIYCDRYNIINGVTEYENDN